MKLTCIGSGSSGNTYLVDCAGDVLVLDCGYSLKDVKVALNFDLSHIQGCFISHEHLDHAKSRKEFSIAGIPIFAPYIDGKLERVAATMGNFKLQAFKIPHGETTNYGVLVSHKSGEKLLYVTDFQHIKYTFQTMKVNHYLIECNYQDKYVDMDAANYKHKIADHASLETCKGIVKANFNSDMKSVILIHLGSGSTNPDECVSEVREIVGNDVFVDYARPHTTYELSNY